MSQTPRTDDWEREAMRGMRTTGGWCGVCREGWERARQLEIELAAMRAKEERLREVCKHLHRALSEIDYVCGEPNEMHLSNYDADFDEKRVVAAVKAMRERAEKAEHASYGFDRIVYAHNDSVAVRNAEIAHLVRELDEATRWREIYHDALIARHGGEPIDLLAELDAVRRENEILKDAIRGVVRYSWTNAYGSFKARHAEAIKIAEGS